MNSKILVLALTLTVGVILIGGVLAPIIADAEHSMTTETYSNASRAMVVLDEVDGSDDYLIQYADGKYTLNGADFYSCNIYTDQGWFFVGSTGISGQYVIGDVTTNTITSVSLIAEANKIHLTPTSLTITDNADNEYTTSITWGYITDSKGSWAVVQGGPVYVESIDQLKYEKSFGTSLAVMEGNSAKYQSLTFSNFVNSTELEHGGYSVEMPLVISSAWTSNEVIAPLSFEVSVPNNGITDLLNAVLVITIVSLVIFAVAAIIVVKRD